MDKQPTQEQIKEFWEWCGFTKPIPTVPLKEIMEDDLAKLIYETSWVYPDGTNSLDHVTDKSTEGGLPTIDLNNLFKYAVLKVMSKMKWAEWFHFIVSWAIRIFRGEDPALALFWVLYPVLKEAGNGLQKNKA